MMKAILALGLLVLLAVPASANGVTIGINDNYVDVNDSDGASVWQETNGLPDLQKTPTCDENGENCIPPDTQQL
jgi:hypothetical protein